MFRIIKCRLEPYMVVELPEVKAGFKNAKDHKIADAHGVIKKSQRIPKKKSVLCFIGYRKNFNCVSHVRL